MVFSLFAVLFESRLCRFLLRPLAAVLPLAALVSGMGWNAVDARAQAAAEVTMNIAVNKPGIKVSPTLWGIFFEEINYAGEGGLWGQLVNNPTLKALGANGQPVGWSLANGTPGNIQLHLDLRNYLKTVYRCWRRYHNNPQAN